MKHSFLAAVALAALFSLQAAAQAQPTKPGAATKTPTVGTQMGKPRTLKLSTKPNKFIPIAEHYTGGMDSLYSHIDQRINYPMMARRNRVQGECVVGLVLNADGSTSDFKIITNKGATLGEEAMRIVKTLKFNAPGYRATYSIPVIFNL